MFRRLRTLGYRVTPQVTAAGFSIDLVVEGDQGRRLAIELDGDQHHPPEQWADDLFRQRTMERMGWRFWRCWGSSFYLDPEDCMADLIQTFDSLGIKPLGGEAPRNVYTEHRVIEEPTRVPAEPELQPVTPLAEADIAPAAPEVPVEPEEAPPGPKVADLLPMAPRSVETLQQEPPQPEMPTEEEDAVEVGDRVLIAYNDEPSRQHTIRISDTEHDPDMRIIRANYPLAQALLGAAVDEELEIPAGGGKRTITVVGIEKKPPLEPVATVSDFSASKTTPHVEDESHETSDRIAIETEEQELPRGEPRVPPPSEATLQPTPSDFTEKLKNAVEFARRGMEHDATGGSDGRLEPSPPTKGSHQVRPYKTWDSTSLPDPRGTTLNDIADRLVEIVEVEGPVVLERAFHLYAGAAGIKRVGNQLRRLFLRASEIALSSGRVEEERGRRNLRLESVVRSTGSPPVVIRKRGPRAFKEIPSSEVREMMWSIRRTHPTTEREVLYRRLLDFYDLKRLTSSVRRSLDKMVSDEEVNADE